MLIFLFKCSILIVRLNIKDYKIVCINLIYLKFVLSQVGFAESNNTADNRANIGGTIIGAPIVGQ